MFRPVIPIREFHKTMVLRNGPSQIGMANIMRMGPPVPIQPPRKEKPMCGPVPFPEFSCEERTTCIVMKSSGDETLHRKQETVCGPVKKLTTQAEQLLGMRDAAFRAFKNEVLNSRTPKGITFHIGTTPGTSFEGVQFPMAYRPSQVNNVQAIPSDFVTRKQTQFEMTNPAVFASTNSFQALWFQPRAFQNKMHTYYERIPTKSPGHVPFPNEAPHHYQLRSKVSEIDILSPPSDIIEKIAHSESPRYISYQSLIPKGLPPSVGLPYFVSDLTSPTEYSLRTAPAQNILYTSASPQELSYRPESVGYKLYSSTSPQKTPYQTEKAHYNPYVSASFQNTIYETRPSQYFSYASMPPINVPYQNTPPRQVYEYEIRHTSKYRDKENRGSNEIAFRVELGNATLATVKPIEVDEESPNKHRIFKARGRTRSTSTFPPLPRGFTTEEYDSQEYLQCAKYANCFIFNWKKRAKKQETRHRLK